MQIDNETLKKMTLGELLSLGLQRESLSLIHAISNLQSAVICIVVMACT